MEQPKHGTRAALIMVGGAVDEAGLRFGLPDRELLGKGSVTIPGYAPVRLAWDESGCAPIALSRVSTVSGRVVDRPAGVRVQVVGCDRQAFVEDDGTFLLECPPGPTTLLARRWDGDISAAGPEVDVVVPESGQVDVDLQVPQEGRARLGITFVEVDDYTVASVEPGGPADLAGLLPGDVIVAIAGAPTDGMPLGDFQELGMGPVGDTVALRIRTSSGERDVTVGRAYFPSPWEQAERELREALPPVP